MVPRLSIVLPCYNERGNLPGILQRYRPICEALSAELILVDNGSTDGSTEVLTVLRDDPVNTFLRTVRVETNIGYGFGLQQGLATAAAPVVAFSHADLQCPPEDLVTAFTIYERETASGPRLVKGRRQGSRPRADRAVTWLYNLLTAGILGIRVIPLDRTGERSSGSRVSDVNAEPKLFDRQLVTDLLDGPRDFSFDLFVLWLTRRRRLTVFEFEVSYEVRAWGRSKLAANPRQRILTAIRAFARMLSWRLHGL